MSAVLFQYPDIPNCFSWPCQEYTEPFTSGIFCWIVVVIESVVFALALSMDACAVSVGLGASSPDKAALLARRAGLYFGLFQALMTLLGYLGERELFGWFDAYATQVACALLVLIAVNMIYQTIRGNTEEQPKSITHRVMLALALATSIDAAAAGFSLHLLSVPPLITVLIVGLVTLCLSWGSVWIGAKSGRWLENKAGLLGGVILLLLAMKTLDGSSVL